LEMTMPESNCKPELVRGRDEPPLGWISHRFDEKVPTPTITWQERIAGTARRLTILRIVANYNA